MLPARFKQGHSGAHVNSRATNEVMCYQQTGQASMYQLLEHRVTKNNFSIASTHFPKKEVPLFNTFHPKQTRNDLSQFLHPLISQWSSWMTGSSALLSPPEGDQKSRVI